MSSAFKGISFNSYMACCHGFYHAPQWWLTYTWNTFENLVLGPELPIPIKEWKRYVDDVFSIIPKGKWDHYAQLS